MEDSVLEHEFEHETVGRDGGFDQPVHCQKKDAQLMSFSIEGALRSMEPENPQQISQAQVHTHPEIQHAPRRSPGEYAILKALSATNKTDDESDGGCDWDHDGTDDCALTVSGGPDFAEIDASQGGMLNQTKYTNKNSDIRRAIEDVDSILRQKNDCTEFFGAYALQALAELDRTLQRGIVGSSTNTKTGVKMEASREQPLEYRSDPVDYPNDGKGPITILTYRVFPIGTVNSYGPFFNFQSRHIFGGYSATSRGSRIAQVLHELAHMVLKSDGKGNYSPLIPNDDETDATAVISTTTILDAGCRDAIENLVNSDKKH